MRKTTASLFAGVAAAILAGAGLGGTAFAASAPLVQECSPTTTGADRQRADRNAHHRRHLRLHHESDRHPR